MKRILLILSFCTTLQAQGIMTADEAIRIGLKNNFDIRIARNMQKISENNTGLGTAEFLPLLDVSVSQQYSRSEEKTNSPFSFGDQKVGSQIADVALNWTLFDGFRMFADKKRYNMLARLGAYETRIIIETNVVNILGAYFNLVQQEQLLDVTRETVEISKTRLYKEKVRQDLGGASSTDFLNAQVSYNNDKALLLEQELSILVARKELNILLGRDPEHEINVKREILTPPLAVSLPELLQMAFEKNSTIITARENKNIADKDIALARSSFLPRLVGSAAYVLSNRDTYLDFRDDVRSENRTVSIGLTLSWNLFNGFRNKINWQNARIAARNQELALLNIKNQLSGRVKETYETYLKRIELMQLEEQNVIAAQQNQQLQQDRYQVGSSSSLEFRDAQVNLRRAQTSLIVARFQARISRLEIDQLTGDLALE